MLDHIRPCYAEINLDNLRHNFKEVKSLVNSKKIFGVIKADAYGHGAIEVARVLREEGIDYFAVAVITEAMELRRNDFNEPILVLGYTPATFADQIVENDITQTVFNYELAKAISDEAINQEKMAKIHIKIDTGMGRLGYSDSDNIIEEIKKIKALPNIFVEGIFSHFSTADEENKEFSYLQLEKFNEIIKRLESEGIIIEIKHIANSGAITSIDESYLDAVRPGIILYGYYPSDEINKSVLDLKPVMTLKSNVVYVKEVEAGTPISYGRKFIANEKMKIATIPIGYADGFTRLLFNKASVIINGALCPVVGKICMDQCMVDVTKCESVNVSDEVIIMGESTGINVNAEIIANKLDTISYEVLCMVSKRVPRVYIENNEIVRIKNFV
ncbi:alanine racemase [Clostridium cylindrosporum]|uniref:Alanine racemase n=1 Tax=Clostridium cylindrosporum DSM 605 TaxID=1121307 RepID=A0A0J8D9Z2_CLOCY|nr:alanine racemase [Clostridium cylindrosporum]KMT21113.1 alanine racemase Alr [Clostridium cylindrosporum DSM 605]